jgi:hypothetical protein
MIADKAATVRHLPIVKGWGRWLKWVCGLLLLIVALLAWDGRMLAMMRFMGNAHRPSLDSDFERLGELLPAGPVLAEMHAGLPHPYHDKDEFFHELWKGNNHSIHGYRLYKQPEKPSAAVAATFAEVLADRQSFRPYAGPKMCGGYHADFAVRLESGGESAWFLVCLGCGEVLIYSKDRELICDLEPVAEERIGEAWKDHLGVPFITFGSRLPISASTIADWGLKADRAWNPKRLEGSGAMVRRQSLWVDPTKRDSPDPGYIKVTEETYRTAEEATRRAEDLRSPVALESNPGRRYDLEEGFAFENRFYRVSGDVASREEIRRIIELMRRYCADTPAQSIRFYE